MFAPDRSMILFLFFTHVRVMNQAMIYIGITSSNRAKEKPGVSRLKDRADR